MWFTTSQVNPTVKIQPLKQKEKESIVPCLHKKKRMLKKSFSLDKFCVAKVTCVETVFKIYISDFFKQNTDFDPITDKIKIKINGDGARMKRNSNFTLLSFSILQTEDSVMSAKVETELLA